MPDRPRNVGASVRQRLLNLAHARGQPMELLLTRYALERLLRRVEWLIWLRFGCMHNVHTHARITV